MTYHVILYMKAPIAYDFDSNNDLMNNKRVLPCLLLWVACHLETEKFAASDHVLKNH